MSLRKAALGKMVQEDATVTLMTIPRGDIRPDPNQPRKTFPPESLRELGADIKANGQDQPILVRETPGADTPFQLLDGERRWRSSAPEYGDFPSLQAKLYTGDVDPEAIRDRQFMINFLNEAMSLEDQAAYMEAKLERLGSVEAVAKQLNLQVTRVYRVLQVAKATGLAAQARDEGLTRDAETIAKIGTVEKRDPEAAAQLVQKGREAGKITRNEVAKAAGDARAKSGGQVNSRKEKAGGEPPKSEKEASAPLLDTAPVVLVKLRDLAGDDYSQSWNRLKGRGVATLCFDRLSGKAEPGMILVSFGQGKGAEAQFPAERLEIISVGLQEVKKKGR